MRSNLLKSLVAFSLAASPTVAIAQDDVGGDTSASDATTMIAAAGFLAFVIVMVLFVGMSDNDGDEDAPPVTPS